MLGRGGGWFNPFRVAFTHNPSLLSYLELIEKFLMVVVGGGDGDSVKSYFSVQPWPQAEQKGLETLIVFRSGQSL